MVLFKWECLFKHAECKLFLPIYLDDFKMAGKKSSLAPMWKKLQAVLDLDPPTKLDGSTYLGCRQDAIPIDKCILESMEQWQPIYGWCAQKGNIASQRDNAVTNPDQPQEAQSNLQPSYPSAAPA